MADIYQMPDRMHRQWRVVEQQLIIALKNNGHADDAISHAIAEAKKIFFQYGIPVEFSGKAETVLSALNEWVSRLTTGMMIEVINREIELHAVGLRRPSTK